MTRAHAPVITAVLIAALLAVMAPAHAQSLNIDYGFELSTPSATYAGSAQPGVWNSPVGEPGITSPLVGLDGTPVNAWVSHDIGAPLGGDDPATSGDDEALLDDGFFGLGDVLTHIAIEGLTNGRYRVVTYGWTPTLPDDRTAVLIDAFMGFSGGPWPGALVEGITHVSIEVEVADGAITIGFGGGFIGANGFLNGIQLEKICPADLTLDGVVGADDLVELMLAWGECTSCAADGSGNGVVDIDDLMAVILNWGECAHTSESLCEASGGTWDPTSCGHYRCGVPPACNAIIPGCDCGSGRTFIPGVGCVIDDDCDG
ncbi:MAG: hypothetical protein ACYTGC_13360, partial [Planctomycetota bacterium]